MDTDSPTQPRIADYIRPLTSRWWLIVVAVVVATGGVYLYYNHKPKVYEATTLVYVTQPGNPVSGSQAVAPSDRTIADVASLFDSRSDAAAVARRIDYHGSAEQLLTQMTISSKQGEDFVQITANSSSAEQAAAIVNAFAQQFVATLTNTYRTQIHDAIKLAETQLSRVPAGAAGQILRGSLTGQINTLQLTLAVPTTVAKQVEPALPPGSPSSPKPARNAMFAFFLSLVAAIAVCYALERFDRRLKHPEELEAAYGTPLLAVLPHADKPAPITVDGPALGREFREPFRVLRTNVELASVDAPPRTIVVSSAMPGEGKSTVVRNLALAFREAGKRVAVVDLDLRHSALAPLFGIELGAGMTDILRGGATLDEVSHHVRTSLPVIEELVGSRSAPATRRESANGTNGSNGNASHTPELTLVMGGARPANPPSVLASERVVEVLDELAAQHDIVLIDTAPVLAVTDTVPLLRYADAALFVGRLGVTTRDTVKHLREFLARVPDLNTLGVVANDLSRTEAGAYGYGYGSAYADPKPDRRRRKETAELPAQTA